MESIERLEDEMQQTHSELEQMASESFEQMVLKSAELTEKGHDARVAQQFGMI